MDEIEQALSEAHTEFESFGTLTTSTFMGLAALGVDAQSFLNDLEDQ